MTVRDAISHLLRRYAGAFVVSSCGYLSRDLFALADRPGHFYMLGSMGMAAPLALGVAIARPDALVLVLDGDGSFVMNLGATAMIASEAPPRLVHAVFDNGMHESTGAQQTVPVPGYGSLGYATTSCAPDPAAIAVLPDPDGPLLVHLPVVPRVNGPEPRIGRPPRQLATEFSRSLRGAVTGAVR